MNRLSRLCLLVLLWSCAAFATSIGFTDSTTASGTIGSISFSDAAITIRGFGNDARVVDVGEGYYFLDLSYVTITIQGVGTFKITTPTCFFSNKPLVGFSRAGVDGNDLIDGPTISQVWNMKTSLGPITGDGFIFQWSLFPVETDAGVIVLNDSDSVPVTFGATVGAPAPEPSTISLLVVGLGSMAGRAGLRRRKQSAGCPS